MKIVLIAKFVILKIFSEGFRTNQLVRNVHEITPATRVTPSSNGAKLRASSRRSLATPSSHTTVQAMSHTAVPTELLTTFPTASLSS